MKEDKTENLTVEISGRLKPLEGDIHFSDFKFSSQDYLAGYRLSDLIGDTFIDCGVMSPEEEWTIIAKALRLHGFSISFTPK
jgi:hypothetical protein